MPTLAELIAERERRRAAAAAASSGTAPEAPPPSGVSMEALIAERDRRRASQVAPVQPDATPWGDGQAFDDLYARKPQTDPMLSPLRPNARTLTSGQPTRLKPPPVPRGPVMSPSQRMATQPARDADVARRTEQANRWKNDSPFGTPVDEMGMPIAVTDAQRDGGMYGVRDDVGKGIVASPIHAERALVGAAEAILNTPGDLARSLAVPFAMGFDPESQGIVANLEFARDEASVANAMDRFANRYEQGGFRKLREKIDAAPRFDFSAAKVPVPKELESVSGALAEGLAQFLISRKLVGKVAPGGGLAANMGKDAAAVFVGMDGSTGRMADIIDANAIPQGLLRDYFNFLKTQPDDSPALGRFKNFLEDLTVSGPMIVPQTVVAPAARVVGNAINPTMTPTNAGGVAARAGLTRPQITPVAPAAAATQPQQPVAPTATQAPQQAPTQPQTVTAPPVPPIPPTAPAVTAGAPMPGPAGQVPPAGVMTPVPNLGPAEQAFNNLPMKTRESMLNAFKSAGVEPVRAKAMIGELNNLPDGQNTMYALEIMRRNGLSDPDIDGVLVAMGREFATESPRPSGRVFNREQDSARQIMNNQVRTQINSEGRSITDVAESRFGPGVVPAGEALDLELDQLSNAYETILSTKRSPTGNLRSPAKKDAVYKAREDLTNALVSPSVMQTIPDDVKLQIMMQASDDMRRLKFKPEELDVVLQGDGAVLAPLFEGYGALSWSPELWSHLARQYPTQAAHSLQSALRKAADEAFRRGDATAGRYYKRLRGESGKGGLLDTLERAVPKYKETRVQFGDASSAKEALDILERFKAAAANEGDVAKIIKDMDGLPQRHREMAEQQITSIIRQELARKVESPRLAELGQTVAQTPNLTALSRQDFLKALEDVFGPRGKELADSIRSSRARTDTLTGIAPKYNSRTELNRQDVQNAPALYEAPGSLEGGIEDRIDQGVKRLGTVAGGASLIPGGQGAAIALGVATAVQAAMNAARRGRRLSNAERNALVDYLFKSRTAGDAAPAAATRGPSMGDYAQAIGRDAVIGAGIGAVADGDPLNNDPMALIGGALGGAAGYGRARFRNARSLIKPPPAPRGAGRPNPPPAGPGVGGPNAPRPLPGQTSSASPAVTGAVVGGIGGAMADREDPARGALLGGLGGAALGSRFGRGVQPPRPRVSPPPVGGPPKPRVSPPKGPGTLSRMVTGGAIGGLAGGVAGEADPQTAETAQKIADNKALTQAILADIAKIEGDMRVYEGGDPLEMQKTLNRRSTDGSFIREDGNVGPETTAAIGRDKTAAMAAFKEKRERLAQLELTGKELEQQAAFERTRPTEDQQFMRDYAPLLGGIAGAAGAKLARIGGTTVSKFTAKSAIKKANALLNTAPISPPVTAADRAAIRKRVANVNEFWKRGGANQPENVKQLLGIEPKRSVPFESNQKGLLRARPLAKVVPPDDLFPDRFIGRKLGAMDALIGGSAATEAVLAAQNAEMIAEKLKTARETLEDDKTEANMARVQELEDQYAQAKALMMLGIGAGVGTGLGVAFTKYASKRADVPMAEQELAILRQYLASQKKPPAKPPARKKKPTTPPLPPSRPRRPPKPPNP